MIKLQESFETPSFIFLVLEFCTQGELFDHMTTVVTVSSKRTRQIMHKLLSVIDHMHEKFIVHRDIKPENILLGKCNINTCNEQSSVLFIIFFNSRLSFSDAYYSAPIFYWGAVFFRRGVLVF